LNGSREGGIANSEILLCAGERTGLRKRGEPSEARGGGRSRKRNFSKAYAFFSAGEGNLSSSDEEKRGIRFYPTQWKKRGERISPH